LRDGKLKNRSKSSLTSIAAHRGGVQAVETGLRLLEAMVELGPAPTLKSLAERAGMPPPQAHRYLSSYCRSGLVDRDPVTSAYRLGPLAVRMGLVALRHLDVATIATPVLPRLRDELQCTVGLAVWGTHGPTFVRLAETDDLLIVSVRPGSVMPILSSATGRVFGAFMPEKLTAPLIAAETSGRTSRRKPPGSPPVPTSKGGIAELFARVRAHGLGWVTGDLNPGVHGVSAPIFDHADAICGALTAFGTAGTFDASLTGVPATTLTKAANELSRRMATSEALLRRDSEFIMERENSPTGNRRS
jgi:DNA-binding IclR family transcriptional regulator